MCNLTISSPSWSFSSETGCAILGFIDQTFLISSILWATAISIHCLNAISRPRSSSSNLEVWYHIVCWGIPAILAASSFTVQFSSSTSNQPVFAPVTLWCWISSTYGYWRMVALYGPLWVAFCFNSITFLLIHHKIKSSKQLVRRMSLPANSSSIILPRVNSQFSASNTSTSRSSQSRSKLFKRSVCFVAVFFAVWMFPTINRIRDLVVVSGSDPSFILNLLTAITAPLQGALNSIVFIYFANVDINVDLLKSKEVNSRRSSLNPLPEQLWRSEQRRASFAVATAKANSNETIEGGSVY